MRSLLYDYQINRTVKNRFLFLAANIVNRVVKMTIRDILISVGENDTIVPNIVDSTIVGLRDMR